MDSTSAATHYLSIIVETIVSCMGGGELDSIGKRIRIFDGIIKVTVTSLFHTYYV